jgi:hypothetical protein
VANEERRRVLSPSGVQRSHARAVTLGRSDKQADLTRRKVYTEGFSRLNYAFFTSERVRQKTEIRTTLHIYQPQFSEVFVTLVPVRRDRRYF